MISNQLCMMAFQESVPSTPSHISWGIASTFNESRYGQNTPTLVPMRERSLQYGDYQNELLRRLFNTKSFFFYCFSSRLKDYEKQLNALDDSYFLMIASVMDRLVRSIDKKREVGQFFAIERFRDFQRKLWEGMDSLQNTTLRYNQLKKVIRSLAYDLTDTLVAIIYEKESRMQLHKYLKGDLQEMY